MNRKVLRIGNTSLGISIPQKWAREQNLKAGMEVQCHTNSQELRVLPQQLLKLQKVTLDITNLDRTSIIYLIQGLYRYGMQEITLDFKKSLTPHLRMGKDTTFSQTLRYIANRLIGFEIISLKSDSCTIKYLGGKEEHSFQDIFDRMFYMVLESCDNFEQAIRLSNPNLLRSAKDQHDTITKFVSYCLRTLNQQNFADTRRTCAYYHITAQFDKIVDVLKHLGPEEAERREKYTKETIKISKNILSTMRIYHQLFYEFHIEDVRKIAELRANIRNDIWEMKDTVPPQQLIFLLLLQQIPELLMDMAEARSSIEFSLDGPPTKPNKIDNP